MNVGEPMKVAFACAEEELAWAGMDCPQDHPCPVYLELSAIAQAGPRIVVAGNIHSASATIDSVLLMSPDNGASWRESAERIRGAALDQMQFVDASQGWAAGEVQYPLARDPFFLITSDGGISWRQQDVSDDGGPGSILSFWFDTVQHGELIIDTGPGRHGGRYTSWESQTGGGSWAMLSSGEKLPEIGGGAPEGPDLRIRSAGRDGEVWQIEKRSGAQWAPLASFRVGIAECVITPGQVKAPEPTDDTVPPPR